jgi:glucokinase
MRVLAGDIGGTNTRLALYDVHGESLHRLADRASRNASAPGLEALVGEFLGRTGGACDAACIGVAAPIVGRRARLTNLAWEVDAAALEHAFAIPRVKLINDLEAVAWSAGVLAPDDLELLSACSVAQPANAAVIAAGTGLGEAGLAWDGARHRPFACEGGHAELAPTSELEIELLRWLWRRHRRVSWERAVSGPGLLNLYRFLLEHLGAEAPEWLSPGRELEPADVSRAGMERTDPTAVAALDLFVRLYGIEAGNLALKLMAFGGVFIAGGIAPRILPKLREGGFMAAFTDKGRMSPLLEAMPVWVIANDRAALLGAARCAASG